MLRSVDDVIDALGGTAATASLAGVGASAVSNWRTRGAIPPENFLAFCEALRRLEQPVADPSVFGFKSTDLVEGRA